MANSDGSGVFELLDLDPEATTREVREAYRKRMALFDPSSPVLYGLYTEKEAQAIVDQLRSAYQHWMSARQLSPLDSLSDEPMSDDLFELIDDAPLDGPVREVEDEQVFDGATLARVRVARGLSLENIAQRTKIAMFTLRSIEADNYRDLPAPVYLRGFLKQLSVLLGLNPNLVVEQYMGRMPND